MDPQLAGLGDLLVGSLLAIVGLLALLLSVVRHQRGDAFLATSFGGFSLLYGVRQILSSEMIGALGVSTLASGWVTATTTYLINVPAWAFFWILLGKRRRSLPFWYVIVVSVFAVVGVLSDLIQREPGTLLGAPNNLMVLAGIVVVGIGLHGYRHRMTTDLKLYIAGLSVFGVMAINDNLVSLGWLPWQWTEESIGFVIYVGFLGLIAVRRAFAAERELVSIEGELETARQIQLSLLPQGLPGRDVLPVAVRFRPTSAVAGDVYDFLRPSPDRLGLLIADVSGHGVPAALIASMVKVAFRSQSYLAERPAELLAGVNQTLCGNLRKGFVTASYVLLDARGAGVICANAGHPSPLLAPASGGELVEIGGHGPILGRFEEARYEQSRHALTTGDRLLLYTDGLVEARNGLDEEFGEDRLRSFLASAPALSLEDLCDRLLAELESFTGAAPALALDDDLTLIALEVPPGTAEARPATTGARTR